MTGLYLKNQKMSRTHHFKLSDLSFVNTWYIEGVDYLLKGDKCWQAARPPNLDQNNRDHQRKCIYGNGPETGWLGSDQQTCYLFNNPTGIGWIENDFKPMGIFYRCQLERSTDTYHSLLLPRITAHYYISLFTLLTSY